MQLIISQKKKIFFAKSQNYTEKRGLFTNPLFYSGFLFNTSTKTQDAFEPSNVTSTL